jgi:hypothetical protein
MQAASALLVLSMALLSACGGGGGSESSVPPPIPGAPVQVAASGQSRFGAWTGALSSEQASWQPGQAVTAKAEVTLGPGYLEGLAAAGYAADQLFVLVTAERTFDADGWMRMPSDENASTLLTPAGLAIEGGVQGPVTTRYGYPFKTPLELYLELPTASLPLDARGSLSFNLEGQLPADLPPGLYRLRADFGIKTTKKWNMDLNAAWMGGRPFSSDPGVFTYAFSNIIPASGTHVSGRSVAADTIQARLPWVLLGNYNSNGYQGVVADEDRHRFALAPRNLIPDEVVLPLYSWGDKTIATYSLEPGLPADRIDLRAVLPWDWAKGELSVELTTPDGMTRDLGRAPFTGKAANPTWYPYPGPTTGKPEFSAWKPSMYGLHTVKATGWMQDVSGRRYEAGGTYRFWIAKRMTMATATFQGMPYPVGSKYGRDIAFAPAVPAEVEISATLYPDSDAAMVRTPVISSGKATRGGIFGALQGLKQLTLDVPGEYHAQILAKHVDAEGHLWVCVMRHAGVIYPVDSAIEAHGKKLNLGGTYSAQGHTGKEGWIEPNGTMHLEHLAFPYNQGDMLLIASENQGANKIEPVMIYRNKGEDPAWESKLNGVGTTNLFFGTSNGLSPHLFPEYITDRQYYYGAAARPGFMGRFVVADSTNRAPYWATSPNSFGGQIAASSNGDLPGDIYRFMGAVVLRNQGQTPLYAGYLASGFVLPKGSANNRVVAAGSEELTGSTGEKARFFLVGLRPGMTYEVGATFRPGLQIDPILPVAIHFVLTYPDGRQQVADGTSDAFGSFAGAAAWPLDMPGVYNYKVTGTWGGFEGRMPGLPESGGIFFVIPSTLPTGAPGLLVDLPNQSTFPADGTMTVAGRSTSDKVSYALLMPGAVLEQGELPVTNGLFSYVLNPAVLHLKAPIYDIVNNTTGKPQLGRVLHLTLYAKEKLADNSEYWDMRRVIVRGTSVLNTR